MKYLLTYNESYGLDVDSFFKKSTGEFGNSIMFLIKKHIFSSYNCKLILDYSGLDVSPELIKPASATASAYNDAKKVSTYYKQNEINVNSSSSHGTDFSLIQIDYGKSYQRGNGIDGLCAYLNDLGHKGNVYSRDVMWFNHTHGENRLHFKIRCKKHSQIEVEFLLKYKSDILVDIKKHIKFDRDVKNKINFLQKIDNVLSEVGREISNKHYNMLERSELIKRFIYDEITSRMNKRPELAEVVKKYPNMFSEYMKETGIQDRIDSIDMGFED